MRVKSQWFKSGRSKTPLEIAGATAFILWRIALNALNEMRSAGFDIAVGPQYFSFLSEFLVFLVQLADRIAYRHYGEEERIAFTTELANRVGENLAENQVNLMGAAAMSAYKTDFIDRLNLRAAEYAEFSYESGASNFSFLRQLGNCLEQVVDERDRRWVTDQVMALQAPEAVETLEKSMRGLLGLEPKRQRTKRGAGGD
jgi:hypothetical protein